MNQSPTGSTETVSEHSRIRDWGLLLGPLLALAIYGLSQSSLMQLSPAAGKTAAIMVWMAIWWMTEALPLPATSLLPLVLFPLLGVFEGNSKEVFKQAATPYANRFVFLLMGGFMIALAIERWGLHRRIALLTVWYVGVRPRRLVAGFMIATAGLSMWISNTATTAMMLPIAISLINLLYHRFGLGASTSLSRPGDAGEELSPDKVLLRKDVNRFATCLMLSVAYAASIGGMTTYVGTIPNAFMAEQLEELGYSITGDGNEALAVFEDDPNTSENQYTICRVPAADSKFIANGVRAGDIVRALYVGDGFGNYSYSEFVVDDVQSEDQVRLKTGPDTPQGVAAKIEVWRNLTISFGRWMVFTGPLVVVMLVLTWLCLTRFIFPFQFKEIPGGKSLIREEIKQLGPMNRGERTVLVVFTMTALLWVSRAPLQDWEWLTSRVPLVTQLSDTVIALVGALSLFAIPVNWQRREFALDWQVASRLPWGVLLLFGGGLSLAEAVSSSGLAAAIAQAFTMLPSLSPLIPMLIVTGVIVLLTEVASNTATVTIMVPLLVGVSAALITGGDSRLLIIPATLAASCAFMLPVATPPNAIVFASERIKIRDMAYAGMWLNLIGLALIPLYVLTWGRWILGIGQ